jgi:hypothetical protein
MSPVGQANKNRDLLSDRFVPDCLDGCSMTIREAAGSRSHATGDTHGLLFGNDGQDPSALRSISGCPRQKKCRSDANLLWRRAWQYRPVLIPSCGSHILMFRACDIRCPGRRSLEGNSPGETGRKLPIPVTPAREADRASFTP